MLKSLTCQCKFIPLVPDVLCQPTQIEGSHDPTLPWSPDCEMDAELPRAPQAVSRFDVGSCSIDPHANDMSGCISAKPLLSLQGRQFPSLTVSQLSLTLIDFGPSDISFSTVLTAFNCLNSSMLCMLTMRSVFTCTRSPKHRWTCSRTDQWSSLTLCSALPGLVVMLFLVNSGLQITQKFCVTMLRLFQWFVWTNIACRSIWFPSDEP